MTTQNVLMKRGTQLLFANTGGDAVWTPADTALAHGRLSAVLDLGVLHARWYEWRCSMQWVDTAAAGDQLRLYLITSASSNSALSTDGSITFGDADVASETVYQTNCRLLGIITSSGAIQSEAGSGVIEIPARYIGIMGWNGSATKALHTTDATFAFTLVPLIDDIQAAS